MGEWKNWCPKGAQSEPWALQLDVPWYVNAMHLELMHDAV